MYILFFLNYIQAVESDRIRMQVLKTIAGRIGDSTTNVQSTSPISNQDDNNDNNDNNEELASSSDDIDNEGSIQYFS